MLITDEKITVTKAMMDKAGMTRGMNLGVPKDVNDLSAGLVWKDLFDLEEEEFHKIEEYFLLKKQ